MERTALIVTCLKDLVLTIAVVVGGGWTLFTFNGELKRENAAAQLRKIEREVSLLERENIDLSIHHHALSVNNNRRGIAFRVLTINTGSQTLNLQLNERSFRIMELDAANNKEQSFLNVRNQTYLAPLFTNVDGYPEEVKALLLAPGEKDELIFIGDLKCGKRYFVEFGVAEDGTKVEQARPRMRWGRALILDLDQSCSVATSSTILEQ